MLVYRVEQHKTELGPYSYANHLRPKKSHKILESMYVQHTLGNHPNWYYDGLPLQGCYIAGFSNHKDLLNWFSGWFKQLHNLRFKVVIYETDTVNESLSGKQINFKKGAKIKEYRIPEFLMLNK